MVICRELRSPAVRARDSQTTPARYTRAAGRSVEVALSSALPPPELQAAMHVLQISTHPLLSLAREPGLPRVWGAGGRRPSPCVCR